MTGNYRLSSIGQSPEYNGLGAAAVGTRTRPRSCRIAGGSGGLHTTQYRDPNGSAGNQLINEAAFTIPFPCSATAAANPVYGVGQSLECFGNAGAGSLINVPGDAAC